MVPPAEIVPNTGQMRLQDFWVRMRELLGPAYTDSYARDHVMSELDGRTVHEALHDGMPAKDIWAAVCTHRKSSVS